MSGAICGGIRRAYSCSQWLHYVLGCVTNRLAGIRLLPTPLLWMLILPQARVTSHTSCYVLAADLWVLCTYKTRGLGSGHMHGLIRETCCQGCSLAESRVVCAKGQGRWRLPSPKDNPTAPINPEEWPTAAVLLIWSPGQNSRHRQRQAPSEVISESPQWVTSAWPCHFLRTPQLQTSVGRSSLLSVNYLYSVVLLLVSHLLHQDMCECQV